WDEVAGREDQFASAAAICVSSQMPPVTLTAPAQPENPISVSPAVKVQSAPANPWPTADPAAPAASIAPIADQSLQLGAAIKDIPVKVANGTVREVKGLPAGVVFDKQTGVISGKPAKAGKYSVQVIAENPDEEAVTAAFTITVTEENTPGDTDKPGGSDKPGDTGKPGTSDKPAPDGNAGGDGKGKAPGGASTGNANAQGSSPALEGTGSNAAIALAAALVLIAAGAVAIKRRRL
ncbi:MAG: putative Ig domain-containing protein, partial [Varibaculum cambriense]|nr:putative Ig domain-containing protein [Varibaculum cambriense]